jgi:hypothetical protein
LRCATHQLVIDDEVGQWDIQAIGIGDGMGPSGSGGIMTLPKFRLIALASVCALAVIGAAAPVNAATPAAKTLPACNAKHLQIGNGPQMSMMTGENATIYTLTNTGSATCQIKGFPSLAVYTAKGKVVPFKYTHSSEFLPLLKPKLVVLKPHASGYVWVGKYRCDLGITEIATKMRLGISGHGAGRIAAPVGQGGMISGWDYCKGGPKDHGNSIAIGPIAAKAYVGY